MTFIIFLIVLGLLIFVHELGHFLAAKMAGVRVDEFGFGYPPRALKLGTKWGTLFTLNWIPFGGFVKIFGENYDENKTQNPQEERSSSESPQVSSQSSARLSSEDFPLDGKHFTQISKKWQTGILVAGVTFNFIFAWLLLSLGFMIGLPTSVDNNYGSVVKDPKLTVIEVLGNSPAKEVGIKSGDKIKSLSLKSGEFLNNLNPEDVSNFITNSQGEVLVEVDRGGEILDFKIIPDTKIEEGRRLIGINMDMVGIVSLPIHKAIYQGGKTTIEMTYLTVRGMFDLLAKAVKGNPDISQIAGPVGIIGLVGDATKLGFVYLLTFTALISINLVVINLIPFPALDGGRILFVAIEGIIKKPIKPQIAQVLNTVGFFLLIGIMLIVTYKDILRMF